MSAAGAPAGDPPPQTPRRIGRWLLLALLAAGGVATLPWWGRRLAFFRVQDVEVRGGRYAVPSEVVARLALDTAASVWEPLDALAARAGTHPLVARATVRRRLPATLVVTVEERAPVALLPRPDGIAVLDADGHRLPIDPAAGGVDLPVVPAADPVILRWLARLQREAPPQFARLSEVRRSGAEELLLEFVDVRVRARRDLRGDEWLALSSVEADLARRRVRPAELDLRFHDLVIARLP